MQDDRQNQYHPKKDLSPGEYAIPLQLYYQACDDRMCYPPKTVDIDLSVNIIEKEEEDTTEVEPEKVLKLIKRLE